MYYFPLASTAAGDLRYAILFPKFKHGDFTVRVLQQVMYMCLISEKNNYNNCLSEGHIDK